MLLLISLLGGCAAAQQAAPPATASAPDGRVLIDVIELSRADLQSVTQTGTIARTSHRFRVDIDKSSGSSIIVSIGVDNRPFARATFRSENYPALDLSTVATHARRAVDGIEFLIRIKYGEGTDCFITDDGRNRLSMHFGQSAAVFHDMVLSTCTPVFNEVLD